MREFISKKIGLFIRDKMTLTSIKNKLIELKNTQQYNNEEISNYRLKKLKKILIYSYEYIPYYKKIMDNEKFNPYNISSIDELSKLPYLTKSIAREENLINPNVKKTKISKTGGTTGVPLIVAKDTNARSYTWAAYYRWYTWMGMEFGDTVITLWGASTVLSTSKKQIFYNKITAILLNNHIINAFEMQDNNMQNIINTLKTKKPKLIKGYLSSLLVLADYIVSHNIQITIPNIAPTSETLFLYHRKKLENAFHGNIFDQYGCTEITSIAFECSHHKGLHITNEHVIVEAIDKQGNIIYDEPGELVVTDLDNYAMPMIRYKIGDIGIVSNQKCSCGINSKILSSILGRTADTIELKNGAKVHGVFFTDIFYELNYPIEIKKIKRFQCVQLKLNSMILKLETLENIDKEFLIALKNSLILFIDNIEIECLEKIPNEASGKFRYIKSDIT